MGLRSVGNVKVEGSELDEHAAVDGAHLELGVARGTAGGQNAQVGALGEALESLGREARGDENLDEELVTVGEVLDERQRDLTIYGDDAAEGALGIAGEGAIVGLGHVGGDGGTAGVLVLENHHAGLVELTHGVPGGLGVEEVVVGQRLALELLGAHERGSEEKSGALAASKR